MARRPHITFISLYPSLPHRHSGRSGVASYTANLAEGLSGQGARVTIVAPHTGDEPRLSHDGDVTVRRTFRRGPFALASAARSALETNADVIHVQWETFLYGGPSAVAALAPALATMRRAGARSERAGSLVATLHHVVDPSLVDRAFVRMNGMRVPAWSARAGLSTIQRTFARLCDRVVVHEPAFADVVARSTVIRHGVESVRPADRERARAELGVTKPAVLCFGFVAPYKGIEAATDAAARSNGSFELIVAGGLHPRLADQNYLDRLARRAKGCARFVGYVPHPLVANLFAAADLALFPYPVPFGSSGALSLALAHGTPVLLSTALQRCMGADPALAVPLSPGPLASAIERALRDPARRNEVAQASARLGSDRSWSKAASAHLDMYEEVIRAKGAARGSIRTR